MIDRTRWILHVLKKCLQCIGFAQLQTEGKLDGRTFGMLPDLMGLFQQRRAALVTQRARTVRLGMGDPDAQTKCGGHRNQLEWPTFHLLSLLVNDRMKLFCFGSAFVPNPGCQHVSCSQGIKKGDCLPEIACVYHFGQGWCRRNLGHETPEQRMMEPNDPAAAFRP